MTSCPIDKLRAHLSSMQTGPITDATEVEDLLAICWEEFSGGEAEGTTRDKLYGRMENVSWEPPVLSFDIERHGGTVMGSTRAEVHRWEVDIDKRTARCAKGGWRQLRPMQPRLNVRPLAEEIARLILNRAQDDRLRWSKDGTVRIQIGKVLPMGSIVSQTLAGRRKRFREAIDPLLTEKGWQKIRPNVYEPPET